ncbi:MAG: phosphoribosylglycinamide formyltransferase [Geminicoccaceae bacterium]
MLRTAILISGGGSNLQALIDASARGETGAEIALVLSNRADAFGLERARRAGIETAVINHRNFTSREAFDEAIDEKLREHRIELVCLAGFMRILGPAITERWQGRMLNIHPSLLPAFKGLHTHERALEAGVKIHGCTVHLVTPELDDGPVLVQGIVPVLPDDTPATLAARVLEVEHLSYPRALAMVAGCGKNMAPLIAHPLSMAAINN